MIPTLLQQPDGSQPAIAGNEVKIVVPNVPALGWQAFDALFLGKMSAIVRVKSSNICRIRLYGDPAKRTADRLRLAGNLPSREHGVYGDWVLDIPDMLTFDCAPPPLVVEMASGDAKRTTLYGAIDSLESSIKTFTLWFVRVPLAEEIKISEAT